MMCINLLLKVIYLVYLAPRQTLLSYDDNDDEIAMFLSKSAILNRKR